MPLANLLVPSHSRHEVLRRKIGQFGGQAETAQQSIEGLRKLGRTESLAGGPPGLLDQPYGDDGWVRLGRSAEEGGSLCDGRTRRVLSFILYLKRGWDASDGGALRIFPAHERGWGTAESQTAPALDL